MRLEGIIEAKDVARVHALMARMASNAFVVHRLKNLEARPDVTKPELWFQLLSGSGSSGSGIAVGFFYTFCHGYILFFKILIKSTTYKLAR